MAVNTAAYYTIKQQLVQAGAILVAVSKTKPAEDILALYDAGQRDFGENYVQELVDKQAQLPGDIRWHFIGHLQSNKVKYIVPFVHLIHGVDSLKLLQEINKQAKKIDRVINCLLQVHIAQEETKFGFDEQELLGIDPAALRQLPNVAVIGLMGMASFTADMHKVRTEFKLLKTLYDKFAVLTAGICNLSVLSMGMSSDYSIAAEEGSTMVRIGSLLFGAREYNK
ncbi:MAG TPA: YggS family pyridoxal phosphate-dependent enzyme [Chitinophagaceae bacterium]|nr:YggS family pyridoxal phosphate-dependent enzyme [Chitinophagaceae bacterium]